MDPNEQPEPTLPPAEQMRQKRLAMLNRASATSSPPNNPSPSQTPAPATQSPSSPAPAATPEESSRSNEDVKPSQSGVKNKSVVTSKTQQSEAPPAKKIQVKEEPIEDWSDKVLSEVFLITIDPNRTVDSRSGAKLTYLASLAEELQQSGDPLKLSAQNIDQAILEAASAVPATKPVLSYLLPCFKRLVRAASSARRPTPEKQAILDEARRLCMSNCLFCLTMPELFGREPNPNHDTLVPYLLRGHDNEESLCLDFFNEAVERCKEDDSVAPIFTEAMVQLSQKLATLTMNDNFKPYVNCLVTRLRQTNRLFEDKDSFATLRDLFRWALRGATTRVPTMPGASPREEMANHGFMLLAERVRNEEERMAVKDVIDLVFHNYDKKKSEANMKDKAFINPDQLYDARKSPYLAQLAPENSHGVVWTHAMRRLYVLVAQALANNEPVLLVGETGCGKTTVCQLLAEALGKELHIVNAHQNTETGDLIGSQRPVRNRGAVADTLRQDLLEVFSLLGLDSRDDLDDLLQRYHGLEAAELSRIPEHVQNKITAAEIKSKALFEWADGSLVHAMRSGQLFLLDEISLADDSVLERLNSVLEPSRTLLLAEKGIDNSFVAAADGFQFFATMNPGGDFGKKELSPALRNRFTEIWVPGLSADEDVLQIVASKLKPEFQGFAKAIVKFSYWFGKQFRSSSSAAFSIRDILVWAKFINETTHISPAAAVVHGAATVFIDTLGANPSALIAIDPKSMDGQRQQCLDKLSQLLGEDANSIYRAPLELSIEVDKLIIGDFAVARAANDNFEAGFALHAPTTKLNAMRVIRALQVHKPILLEGSPGVGKTTLVSALAKACGQPLTRINLSDQTDLMDLFGTDVPVEGAEAGHFAWRDAPFLRAMQNGEWVLLDEMNLASQSVLEGLNACLDHRGEVYISELDQSFKRHPNFRLFAAQNPHHQGGGRKGLPSSFVNRFIVVYADVFTEADLLMIARHNYPGVPSETVKQLIAFISSLDDEVVVRRSFGAQGAPWEFNLRDTLRWLELLTSKDPLLATAKVDDFLDIVIRQRFRSTSDRQYVNKLFAQAFLSAPTGHQLYHNRSASFLQVGLALLHRDLCVQPALFPCINEVVRLPEIESLLICIKQNLPCILAGPSGCGKSALLQHVAALAGKSLVVFPMNADIDAMDLVGGFEQHDPLREVNSTLTQLKSVLQASILSTIPHPSPQAAVDLLNALESPQGQAQGSKYLLLTMQALQAQITPNSELATILSKAQTLLARPNGIRDPTFEWLDGIIVQALQKGEWLVLDNANLCSASVLDRLNSLLEPNGFLIINEHCGPNGEPRIIKPHPDFRVFLTMDPRYGELSRAMRNRAIEVYLDHHGAVSPSYLPRLAQIESSLRRFEVLDAALAVDAAENDVAFGHVATDNLALAEMHKYRQYRSSCQTNILSRESDRTLTHRNQKRIVWERSLAMLDQYLASTLPNTAPLDGTIRSLYAILSETVSAGFGDSQPHHTLQNSALVPLVGKMNPGLPEWLGVCYEIYLDLTKAHRELETQVAQAQGRQPSLLSRLQRSCISGSVAAVAKDSTVGAYKFLSGTLEAVENFMRAQMTMPGSWEDRKHALGALMHYWWRTFHLLSAGGKFDEARFQAHLGQGADNMSRYIAEGRDTAARDLIAYLLRGLEETFVAGFKLTTGLSMQPLWEAYRPLPIVDSATSAMVHRIEALAPEFDKVKWNARSSIGSLVQIMTSLVKVYSIVRDNMPDCEDLINNLEGEIKKLEEKEHISPTLAKEFEYLRQLVVLETLGSQKETMTEVNEMVVLSNMPILAQMRLQSHTSTSKPLQMIGYLMGMKSTLDWGDEKSLQYAHPWTESLSVNVVSKLDGLESTTLQSLGMLEAELPVLGQLVAKKSEAVTSDPLDKLRAGLVVLMRSTVAALGPEFSAAFDRTQRHIAESLESGVTFDEQGLTYKLARPLEIDNRKSHLDEVLYVHLVSSLVSLRAVEQGAQPQRVFVANAWLQFALALVKLYIPDRMYDPQLRPLMDLQSYEEQVGNLQGQLSSLKRFELFYTGQTTNARCQLLDEEIRTLGEKPVIAQTVYRPQTGDSRTSQHQDVQGSFNSVLKTVLGADIPTAFLQHCFGSDIATQQLQVVRQNVSQIISRLTLPKSPEYEDLSLPAANILHCLDIGLSLGEGATAQQDGLEQPCESLLKFVPLMGGSSRYSLDDASKLQGMDLLSYVSTVISVEGLDALDSSTRRAMFQAIHSFYDQWSQKLEADRKAEEQRQSMYRYQGGFEDEEAATQEAFDKLFPSYDEDKADNGPNAQLKTGQARALAIKLAGTHRDIFLSARGAPESIRKLCKLALRKVSKEDVKQISDRALLPATLMVLDEKLTDFKTTTTPASYNFYTDTNLAESRRLVKLVNEIRAQFRQLQKIEEIGHLQPLEDAVLACDTVLEEAHSAPLAKIITSVERLHSFVYEWQFGGWASKIHGVLPVYNQLTDMLVSWRRLELSTWGKLFDMEVQKCEDDANSWWFVAYQAIIAGPMALAQAGDSLQDHATGLLKQLEVYFSSADVGQFSSRVNLLRQLRKQLDFLVLDWPAMSVISDAVQNFISFYSRFEKVVQETIQRGRAPIEKQMRDVLLLASWKDTNIVALRESARKSHHKLFRIVRKFRDVLGQSMKTIIDSGLPDETHPEPAVGKPMVTLQVHDQPLAVCAKGISRWDSEYKRLASAQQTVNIMAKLGRPSSIIDAAGVIADFLSDLDSTSTELRKETPSVLTEENTNVVKHLKTRKRKLFADVLREIREMGFRYNLSMDSLAEQDSLAIVLSRLGPLAANGSTDYYFHRLLDMIPRVRGTAHEHSEDLTGAEVMRSIGLIEGMLHVIRRQRVTLSTAHEETAKLDSVIKHLKNIASQSDNNVRHQTKTTNVRSISAWTVEILGVAVQLVEIHGRIGNIDNGQVVSRLRAWAQKLAPRLAALPVELPERLVSAAQLANEEDLTQNLAELDAELKVLCQERADLAFVFEQIGFWTAVTEHPIAHGGHESLQNTLLPAVKTLGDSILVAVEQVHKAYAKLPTATDESGWLSKHDEAMVGAIRSLHIGQIRGTLNRTLSHLLEINLGDETSNQLATSLVGAIYPIVEQYRAICQQTISTYSDLNTNTSKMAFTLSKSFVQLAGQGFCTPKEKSEETSGETGNLEEGTGLGEGEGAEDISKDVQPDEDLTELAQQKNEESRKDEIEDEKDAVDMADEDMEGEMGSAAGEDEDEKGSQSGDEDEKDDMDEETGDVDDLDPTAVDEKMWDGENEDDAEKEQQGDQTQGKEKDEQMAADSKPDDKKNKPEESGDQADEDQPEQKQEEEDQEEDLGAEQNEGAEFEEMNHQDQNVEEQDALALPDDMDIDGNDDDDMSSISDDDLDKLSDVDEKDTEEKAEERANESDNVSEDGDAPQDAMPADEDKGGAEEDEKPEEENANVQPDEEMGEDPEEEQAEDRQHPEMPNYDDANPNQDNVAPSDVRNGGQDQDANQTENQDSAQDSSAQRESGEMGESAAEQDASTGDKGSISKSQEQPAQSDMDNAEESTVDQPFKALGDALEKWHRQQRDIKEAQTGEPEETAAKDEQDMASKEFQHLQNDDMAADTQAIGTTTEEESRPFDDAMAIDDEEQAPDSRVMPEDEEPAETEDAADKMDVSEPAEAAEKPEQQPKDEGQPGVSTRRGAYDREMTPPAQGVERQEQDEEDVDETSAQLSETYISEPAAELRDFDEAMQQWGGFQAKTNPLSLALTSQLRLILTPSQSTKLSGSYRTGKRLNIKRIIPYIASSYKRDKIWMRRAIPTKRSYQILLCVDDSKSMGESASGALALESLVMVSRALTLLEVGQIGVLGFGQHTFMAHDFAEPFASHDAGARVLQRFRFQQDHTDVKALVRDTIARFRAARLQNPGRGGEDLWQLALILSDGLTPSQDHDEIRRLLREAMEERIMVVFIIMDEPSSGGGGKTSSVLNLRTAKFVTDAMGDMKVKTETYLDTFPFQYYLIVHDLQDLPAALAGLLRSWFAEVNA